MAATHQKEGAVGHPCDAISAAFGINGMVFHEMTDVPIDMPNLIMNPIQSVYPIMMAVKMALNNRMVPEAKFLYEISITDVVKVIPGNKMAIPESPAFK
jgi:hypothetical protein